MVTHVESSLPQGALEKENTEIHLGGWGAKRKASRQQKDLQREGLRGKSKI